MHVLALDFDGVLCDSSREVLVVAVDTFTDLEPGSRLIDRLAALRDDAVAGRADYKDAEIYARFRDLLPLGNRAEDFGVSLRAVEDGAVITDQQRYDAFYRSIDRGWLDQFHARFYERREELRAVDVQAWRQLHLPFPGLADTLRRHLDRTRPAIATAKDARSVELLLDEMGFDKIFEPEMILDKETGVEKTHHLRVLQARTGARIEDMTFVDDKVNHLVAVAGLGVRGVLAGWGFNDDREHRLARELGFEVADLTTADEVLFRGE